MADYKESDYKELTKEEKKNMMLLFKKALIDNDEEQFFSVLHFVIGDWYLWACAGFPTTATKAPRKWKLLDSKTKTVNCQEISKEGPRLVIPSEIEALQICCEICDKPIFKLLSDDEIVVESANDYKVFCTNCFERRYL